MVSQGKIKGNGKALPILFWLCLAVSVALSVFMTWAHYVDYDDSMFVYSYQSVYPTVIAVAVLAGVVLFSVFGAIFGAKNKDAVSYDGAGKVLSFFSMLCCFFLAASVLMYLIYAVSGLEEATALRYVGLALAVPSAIYFLNVALRAKGNILTQTALGCCLIAWLAVNVFYLYYDKTMPHTSQARQFAYVVLLAFMLDFVLELRNMVGETRPIRYYAVSFATMPILASGSICQTVMTSVGRHTVGMDSILPMAELSMTVYLFVRLFLICNKASKMARAKNPISEISEKTEEREEP